MGIYLNPGNAAFKEALCSEIYVDKTGLIKYTNSVLGTKQKNICVSRPRRFGKSMAAEMLLAYYCCGVDSSELFSGLEIADDSSFRQHLNQYDVIFLNIQDFLSRAENVELMVSCLQDAVIYDLKKKYQLQLESCRKLDMVSLLEEIYRVTGQGFVFIIDEWDCIFRERKYNKEIQNAYLDFLRSLLKDKVYVKLAYMTGILPIKKYGTHSALNMFSEFSMTNPRRLAQYVGFTEYEVRELCDKYRMDFGEAKRWYDGYWFRRASHVYNPKSVVDAMLNGEFDNYWTQTETYEALRVYISMNFDGLKDAIVWMLGGGRCKIDAGTFQNDMTSFTGKDDVLTLLVHLGYLAYDADSNEVFIPNEEVQSEFDRAIRYSGWEEVGQALSLSEKLVNATWGQDAELVAEILNKIHMETASILEYNNENALSCIISLAYYSAKSYYTLVREFPTGYGFADIVFLPRVRHRDKPALVVELKWNRSAEGAIKQIKERKYISALKEYEGNLLLVGINYDKGSKKHDCIIEKLQQENGDSYV